MKININFEDTYPFVWAAPDLSKFIFISPVVKGAPATITVKIRPRGNQFVQDFMNLSFGVEVNGDIDDFASIPHKNISKTFSTVLLCAYAYLGANPDAAIGIDGSDFRRAYFYFRILQSNYAYLQQHFSIYGLKYFVRLIRGKDKNDFFHIDPDEVITTPHSIENKPLKNHKSLFNHFMLYFKRIH